MRSMMTWALAVGVVLALTSTASAQRGRGRGGFGGPSLLLVQAVQDELKLTDKQKEEAQALAEKTGEKMRGAFQDAGGDFSKIFEISIKVNAEGIKEAGKFLKPEQLARLKGINWQALGLRGLALDEELQKTLKIDASQKEKLTKLSEDLGRDTMELAQGGGFGNPETQQKMQALTKTYGEKADQVLNAEQRKAYTDLLGKRVELPTFGRGRRGGGGE